MNTIQLTDAQLDLIADMIAQGGKNTANGVQGLMRAAEALHVLGMAVAKAKQDMTNVVPMVESAATDDATPAVG